MGTPTLSSLQIQVNAILARLALIDGQGLATNIVSYEAGTTAAIDGLKDDIQNGILTVEATVNTLTNALQTLQGQLDQLLGLAGITYTPVTILPPTT